MLEAAANAVTAARIDAGASVTECTSSKALALPPVPESRLRFSAHRAVLSAPDRSPSPRPRRSSRRCQRRGRTGFPRRVRQARSQSRCIHWQRRAHRSLPRVQPPGMTFIRGYPDVVWTRSRQLAPVAALLGRSRRYRPRARRCRSATTAATRAVLAQRAGRSPRPPGVGRAPPRCARVIRRVGRQRRGCPR